MPNADPCFDLADDRAYRVFRLDRQGRVASAEIIPAASDDHARTIAGMLPNRHGLELWERTRHLGRYPHAATSEA